MSEQKNEAYYQSLDKRTKEYKEWKKKQSYKGLGDVVEDVLEKTGVGKVAKWLLGDDCGCEDRKDRLNELFPFRNTKCLNEDEYKFLDKWFKKTRYKITHKENEKMVQIHNRVFNKKHTVSSCSGCIKTKVQELKRLYLEYKPTNDAK